MKPVRSGAGAVLASLLVAACGGGGSDTTPKTAITSVTVMGDSLADSGTYGYKFTVQGADSLIYPERVAQSYGIAGLCPHYAATSATTFVVNPTPGCTNYAVGGSRINNVTGPTAPTSIVQQLADASATASYTATDLIVIDGGGNDAADLVGAYLQAPTDGGASYSGLLGTLLPAETVGAALATGAAGFASIGGTYMTALADQFAAAITANTLAKGATHVAVLNMPGITNTPRFQTVLDSIAAANGGGTAGATARAQAEGLFQSWFVAFNTELTAKLGGNASVVIVDFYSEFNVQIANPAQYALTNVTTPACPATGVGADGLPVYDFPSCTDSALSAETPPDGATGGANWWKTWQFSDGFHPTPYGHQLLSQLIARSLATAGWL